MPDTVQPPSCKRCGGATSYRGMVSLPPQNIFLCGACGETMWVAKVPPTFWPAPADPVNQQPQQQQQQQQQVQPQKKHGDKA